MIYESRRRALPIEKDKGLVMNKECEASHNRIKFLAAQLVKLYKNWRNDLNEETSWG